MKLEILLSRVDVDFFQDILGQNQLKLLNLTSQKPLKISELRTIALSFYTEADILRKKEYRNSLFDYLNQFEAESLSSYLGLKAKDLNYYSVLLKTNFQKESKKEKLLFSFFEIEQPKDIEFDLKPDSEEVVPQYALFSHQIDVSQKIIKVLDSDLPRCILHMPTGSGKTRTAMNIISKYIRDHSGVVVWLAYSKELCEQGLDEFLKAWSFLGNRSINIHRLWGPHSLDLNSIDSGFVVAGFDKLYNLYKKDHNKVLKFGNKVDFLIIDEAHQSIAPTYETVIRSLTSNIQTKILGLTATPGRTSDDIEKDLRLSSFFSQKKIMLTIPGYINPVDFLVEQGYLARALFEPLTYDGGIELSEKDLKAIERNLDIPSDILEKLATNEQRNLQIFYRIKTLVKGGHKRILLFGTTVQHAMDISSLLSSHGIHAPCVTGITDLDIRTNILTEYKSDDEKPIVLCNYGVLTTGFDAPQTSAAIIARPTKSLVLYSQMVGRAIRGIKAGGNKEATIITTVDINLPGFNSVEDAFINWEDVYKNNNEKGNT